MIRYDSARWIKAVIRYDSARWIKAVIRYDSARKNICGEDIILSTFSTQKEGVNEKIKIILCKRTIYLLFKKIWTQN